MPKTFTAGETQIARPYANHAPKESSAVGFCCIANVFVASPLFGAHANAMIFFANGMSLLTGKRLASNYGRELSHGEI